MSNNLNKNEKCLKLRNQTTRSEETYCKYYTKKFRGYVRHLFINTQMIGVVLGMIFIAVLIVLTKAWQDEDKWGFYIGVSIFSICFLFWVYSAIKGLWFWKYAKHVVVTNEGIWIMWYGALWRHKDFKGKKRFLSPSWSVYDWGGIKITDDDKARPHCADKIMDFFDNFDYAVIKSSHLTSLFITRFDGVEQIHFLDKSDTEEILAYAKERKRKKRQKKETEIIEDEILNNIEKNNKDEE